MLDRWEFVVYVHGVGAKIVTIDVRRHKMQCFISLREFDADKQQCSPFYDILFK